MDWTQTWRSAIRTELRAEAIGLASHGWPVVPGTFPNDLEWEGRQNTPQDGPVPIDDDWATLATDDMDRVGAMWAGHHYTILLATGRGVDVLEVPAELGRRAATELRAIGLPVPIAATPAGRWLFPVRSGEVLHARLAGDHDVVVHAQGSWVPLPPSPFLHGVVHWRVTPHVTGWALPRSCDVQHALGLAVHEHLPVGAGALTT